MAEVLIDGEHYVPKPKALTDKSLLGALAVRFDFEGSNISVRDYLRMLLETLWDEQEEFSGKRPFGNSGWDYDIIQPLVVEGFIKGKINIKDDPEFPWADLTKEQEKAAHAYVKKLILAAFEGIDGNI